MRKLGKFQLNPIIKVVGESCNLKCTYCFYDGFQQTPLQVMKYDVLDTVLKRLFEFSSNNIHFIWHGGEPTLAGIEFYREVVRLQNLSVLPNQIFTNSMQTNGTLITPEWSSFLSEYKFNVGISLDGPEHIHNYARLNFSGKGSFDQVMRGLHHLRKTDMHIGAIAVINSYSVDHPDEMFAFFYENRLDFSANNCDSVPGDSTNIQELAVDAMEYAHFLLRIFDLWLETDDPNFIRIRPLTDFIQVLMGHKAKLCKFKGSCYQYITIDVNGDVYPCCDYRKSEHLLGNLVELTFGEIVASEKFRNYYHSGRQQTLTICDKCRWVQVCKGWCRRTWNGETGVLSIQDHVYCEALQLIFSTISAKLDSLGYNIIL